jgi:hypothetical protein
VTVSLSLFLFDGRWYSQITDEHVRRIFRPEAWRPECWLRGPVLGQWRMAS